MTTPAALPDDLVLRPLADAGELALLTTLSYTLDDELADDRVAVGAALHRAASAAVLADASAGTPPEYMRFVPGEWRDAPAVRRAVEDRVAVVEGAGARLKIERHHPIIAYAGVVPAHRGHGHIDDLLAEGTRILAAQPDVARIRAATDLTNTPMAAAFRRAGYVTFERALHYTWD